MKRSGRPGSRCLRWGGPEFTLDMMHFVFDVLQERLTGRARHTRRTRVPRGPIRVVIGTSRARVARVAMPVRLNNCTRRTGRDNHLGSQHRCRFCWRMRIILRAYARLISRIYLAIAIKRFAHFTLQKKSANTSQTNTLKPAPIREEADAKPARVV